MPQAQQRLESWREASVVAGPRSTCSAPFGSGSTTISTRPPHWRPSTKRAQVEAAMELAAAADLLGVLL